MSIDNLSESPDDKKIIDFIKAHHPEYLTPGAHVTTEFIKLVDEVQNIIHGIEDLSLDPPTNEEADRVLECLPEDLIAEPLNPLTVNLIGRWLACERYQSFLEDTANSECQEASCLNNRAAARAELGRYDEALNDYNKACELEPDEPNYFMNRASLLMFLRRQPESLKDAMYIYERIWTEDSLNYHHLEQLALIFQDCGKPYLAIACVLRLLDLFKRLLPYGTIDKKGGFYIERNGVHILTRVDKFRNIFLLIKKIESENRNGRQIASLIETAKLELLTISALGGF